MTRNRRMGLKAQVVGWAVGCALLACAHPLPADAASQQRQVWVDARAHAGAVAQGQPAADGSPERPLRSLKVALEQAAQEKLRIHLRAGLYEGPFVLPDGVELEGHGEVVLHAPGDADTVVTAQGSAALTRLRIQGGRTGVQLQKGTVRVDGLKLSGQQEVGLEVQKGAVLEAHALEVEGTISGTVGVQVMGGGTATLQGAHFLGGLQEGLRVEEGGNAKVKNARSEGPAQAIRCIGCTLEVDGLVAQGGRMAAVGAGRGRLKLSRITVVGHEYALLAGSESEVQVRGLTSLNADRAGIGLAASKADLEDILILGAGAHGGVNAVGSQVRLRRFIISRARAYGLSLHGGEADVAHGVVRDVTDDGGGGDGVHARIGKVRLAHLHLSKLEGVGVLAAQSAEVTAQDLTIDSVGWAGILAERGGRLSATSVSIRGSQRVAAAVPDEGFMALDVLHAQDNAEGTLWADCGQGAQVTLSRLRAPDLDRLGGGCVERRNVLSEPSSPAR